MLTAKQFVKKIFEDVKSNWFLPVTEHQVYSTTETVVGVWTDGKPLYRKVLQGVSGSTNTWVNGTVALENECRIVFADVYIDYQGQQLRPVPYGSGDVRYVIADNVININIGSDSGLANEPVIAICHYTKTTDTASSPKVPFEPLVEYSTEEKIIGYWIDGKPIYRKTINGNIEAGAITDKTTTNIYVCSIQDAEYITSLYGRVYDTVTPTVWYANNITYFMRLYTSGNEIYIQCNRETFNGKEYAITIEYTKTT